MLYLPCLLYTSLLSLTLFLVHVVHIESLYLLSFFFLLLGALLGPSSFFFIPYFHRSCCFYLSPLLLELADPCFVDSPHCWILLGLFTDILFWACGIFFLHFITNVDIFAFSSSLLDFFKYFCRYTTYIHLALFI